MHKVIARLLVIATLFFGSCSAGEVTVGLARTCITPELPSPLAGYSARFGLMATRVHDDVQATAMVMQTESQKIALVSVDLCGVSAELRASIAKRVLRAGCTPVDQDILLAATHTHAGPGGYVYSPLFTVAAGVYQQRIFDHLASRIADAIVSADASRKPARVAWGSATVRGFQHNRRGEASLNERMTVIKFATTDGKPIAAIVQFTGHPTILRSTDMQIGRDWPGALCDAVESGLGNNTKCLVFNGALGDLEIELPRSQQLGSTDHYEHAAKVGKSLGGSALNILNTLPDGKPIDARLITRPCEMPRSTHPALLPPRPTVVNRLTINGLWLLTVPGEAVSEIGAALQESARHAGAEEAVIVGCANDYLGYFVTPPQAAAGGYEPSMSFFGPNVRQCLESALLGDLKHAREKQ